MSFIRHRPSKFRSLKLLSESAISPLSKPANSSKCSELCMALVLTDERAESCVYVNVLVHSFAMVLLGRGLIRRLRSGRGLHFNYSSVNRSAPAVARRPLGVGV